MPSHAAVILELPAALSGVTSPEALTPTEPGTLVAQVATLVRSCVVPSRYVPVAESCCEGPISGCPAAGGACPSPKAVTTVGEIVTALSATGATVTVSVPEISPEVAVIVAVPAPTAVATPPAPIEITPMLLDDQLAPASPARLPSELFPVAVNVSPAPSGIGGIAAGAMLMLCSTGTPTLTCAAGETIAPSDAVICAVAYPAPVATAVAAETGFVPSAGGSEPSHTSRTMNACWPPLAKN